MMMAGAPIFWGKSVGPGKELMVDIDYDEVVHLTQVSCEPHYWQAPPPISRLTKVPPICPNFSLRSFKFALGAGAKNGERVVIQVENNEDEPVVLGTLICGTCDQFCADLMVGGGDLVRISHTSKKATVHITGYKQEDIFSDDESLDLPPLEGEELPEDELEDLRAQVKKHVKKNKGQDLLDEDFTDSDSDSDDSDSDSDDEDFGGNPSNFSDDDDDDDDEGLSSESMETGSEDSDDSDDGDSGDDDSEDDDSGSESESESSEDEEDKLKKLKGRKRADSSPASPQTPKRSKTSDSAPSSAASTPGRTPVLGDAKSKHGVLNHLHALQVLCAQTDPSFPAFFSFPHNRLRGGPGELSEAERRDFDGNHRHEG